MPRTFLTRPLEIRNFGQAVENLLVCFGSLLRDVSRPVMGGGHAWPSLLIGRLPLLPTPTAAVSGPGGSCCVPPVAVGQKTPPPSRRRLLGVQGRHAKRKEYSYMMEEVSGGDRQAEVTRGAKLLQVFLEVG